MHKSIRLCIDFLTKKVSIPWILVFGTFLKLLKLLVMKITIVLVWIAFVKYKFYYLLSLKKKNKKGVGLSHEYNNT